MEYLIWPYDEVSMECNADTLTVSVKAPWMSIALGAQQQDLPKIISLAEKQSSGSLAPKDLADIKWFYSGLMNYPLCYTLPRSLWDGSQESYAIADDSLLQQSMKAMAELVATQGESLRDKDTPVSEKVHYERLAEDWKWDFETAIAFSKIQTIQDEDRHDPLTLLTVARRFHLLSHLEEDQTSALFDFVKKYKKGSEEYNKASALMVRQNHYVTQRCDASLRPAIETAKGAKAKVEEFIHDEQGHDRILDVALKSFVAKPEDVKVMPVTKLLMDALTYCAQRNYLAFTMAVDFFERSSYQDSDPLAQVLKHGGLTAASKQIDRHKDINDEGEHENVSFGFIENMGPVSPAYAKEALMLAEFVTTAMNLIAKSVYDEIKN